MTKATKRPGKRRRQSGMTLIELLIASIVLVVGLLALFGVMAAAIADNGKSRSDSTATMLAQAVIEDVGAAYLGETDTQLRDCKGTTFSIRAEEGGARVYNGYIDFTEGAPPANYHMDYIMCNGEAQTAFDVRWHVAKISDVTELVTVGVRQKSNGKGRLFSVPVNLRVYVGK